MKRGKNLQILILSQQVKLLSYYISNLEKKVISLEDKLKEYEQHIEHERDLHDIGVDEPSNGMTDAEADADTFRSIGRGTDEDYRPDGDS